MKNPKFEKYIFLIIKQYSKVLLLEQHTFKVRYGTESSDALMECTFAYPYLNITLNYSDKVVEKWKKKEDVIPFIVHEMCHPITDPLYAKTCTRYVSKNEVEDEREKLTDYIANIVLKNKL